MLKFKTYIDQSTIPNAGLGLFTSENIKSGDIVWQPINESEIVYTQDEWDSLPDHFIDSIKKYVYKCEGLYRLNVDNARHMNHSDNPNLIEDEHGNNVAACDIPANSELFCDYYSFYDFDYLQDILFN